MEIKPWAEAKRQTGPDIFESIEESSQHWRQTALGLSVPTLLVTGEPVLGATVTADTASMVSTENRKIQVAHIPKAGHNIHRDQYEVFMTAVRSFLAAQSTEYALDR